VLLRFARDDEAQVKAVLHDLCDSQLVFSSGTGTSSAYRAASEEESVKLQGARGSEGEDELLVALIYREGPRTLREIARLMQSEPAQIEPSLERLLAVGRIERIEQADETRYLARALVIPLGAPAGWEGAVFDHFKALVTTVLGRLRENRPSALEDRVGGSTYTIDVWDGHPLADEVYSTLSRLRSGLSEMRTRVVEFNAAQSLSEPQLAETQLNSEPQGLPEPHSRVVIYVGQSVIQEGHEQVD
jgi:hypothetical protein